MMIQLNYLKKYKLRLHGIQLKIIFLFDDNRMSFGFNFSD